MSDIRKAQIALVKRILEGGGKAAPSERRAAFSNTDLTGLAAALADKAARHPHQIADDDIAAAKATGLSEDQIFEIVVCASVGQATRQYEAAMAALRSATVKE